MSKQVILGFTGTQEGMTIQQIQQFEIIIKQLSPNMFIHGDCIGADAEAHNIISENFPNIGIEIFPPIDEKKRAFCKTPKSYINEPMKYLDRNRAIVDSSTHVIACPKQFHEVLRSGTWMTIRYARKLRLYLIIIYPDGSTNINGLI